MHISRRKLFHIGFFAAVLILTFCSVLKGVSLSELADDMQRADKGFLLLAVGSVLMFLILQAVVIYVMLIAVGLRKSIGKCILFSFTGYFYCSITPFQSGGPPAQIVLMKKEGIPVAMSSIVILIMTFLFKAVLVAVGIWYLLFGWTFLGEYLSGVIGWFCLGMVLTIGFTAFLAIFIFSPSFARRILLFLYDRFVEKGRLLKRFRGQQQRILSFVDRYKETASFFRTHRKQMGFLFGITFFQRFFYFLTTYFVYRAFGLDVASFVVITLLQACISISVDLLPLPGGTGITEALFLKIFQPLFGAALVLPGMMLARGISYYVQLFFCAILTVAARFFIGKDMADESEKLAEGQLPEENG
jgi:uncharacterized protein (TIRG00374 family)